MLAPAGQTPSRGSVERDGPSLRVRLEYLARLAQRAPGDLPEQANEAHQVRWTDGAQLNRAIARIKADVLRRWTSVAELLVQAGALERHEAATVLPAIDVALHDSRRDRVIPLPSAFHLLPFLPACRRHDAVHT